MGDEFPQGDCDEAKLALLDYSERAKKENEVKEALVRRTLEEKEEVLRREKETISLVKSELLKIDKGVSNEIAVLRKQIDQIGTTIHIASKRLKAAEKEYVAAKACWEEATEKKRLLTEHMHVILLDYERTRAQKLEELMGRVGASPRGNKHDTPRPVADTRLSTYPLAEEVAWGGFT